MAERADLDLAGLLAELRRRAWLVLAITAAAAVLAFLASQLQDDRYEATAELLFRGEPNANAPERSAATNLALANLDAVLVRVRRRLALDLPPEELRERVELQPRGQADLLQIEASAATAAGAAQLANVFAAEVVAVRRETARDEVQRRIDSLDARLAEIDPKAPAEAELTADLIERRKSLLVDKALVTGDVEVADGATPPRERAAPQPLRDAGIAGVLGVIVAVMLVALLRAVDRRLTERQATDLFGAPVLARVPVNGSKPWRRQLYDEAVRFLMANVVVLMADDEDKLAPGVAREEPRGRVLVLTSPLPATGKSSIVARLGEALAASGIRVLAIDGDLRKPTLARELGLPEDRPALAEVMLHDQSPARLLQEAGVGGLSVLTGASAAGSRGPVASPHRMLKMVEILRGQADLVLVDTAPVAIAAETSIFAARADGVIVVLDARNMVRETLTATRDQLQRAGARVLGLVLNFAEAPDERALKAAYGGSYGAAWRQAPPAGPGAEADGRPPTAVGDEQGRPTPQAS